jgi:hypothetical protein
MRPRAAHEISTTGCMHYAPVGLEKSDSEPGSPVGIELCDYQTRQAAMMRAISLMAGAQSSLQMELT